jgi:hypothetical protein
MESPPVQLFIGSNPCIERMHPIQNGDGDLTLSQKAVGGIWTSSSDAWFTRLRKGITLTYLASHPDLALWRCEIRPDVRVWWIDTFADLHKLLLFYGRDVPFNQKARPRDWLMVQEWLCQYKRSCHRSFHHAPKVQRVPNFERMKADGWDGMRLTERGTTKTSLTLPNLYGWDCECTLWFTWPFGSCTELAVLQWIA